MNTSYVSLVFAMLTLLPAISHADEAAYGSPAPGKLSCGLTYFLYDASAAPPQAQPPGCFTCTMANPQHSMVSPAEFKKEGSFTYLYYNAKRSNITGSDELLSFDGSAQIGADGHSTGMLILRRGDQVLVHVMGPVVGEDLQVQIPGQGLKYQGKIVEQIQAYCFVQ
jgi:hypothetical protein